MLRRLLPTLIAMALVLLATLAGLIALQGVFIDERDDALTALDDRRTALEQYASVAVAQQLDRELTAARTRIDAAMDPRDDTEGLYLRVAGVQELPRMYPTNSWRGEPARELYEELVDPNLALTDPNLFSPWAVRLTLRQELISALRSGDADESKLRFDNLLYEHSRQQVPAVRDLPYMLAMLRLYGDLGHPSPILLNRLLDSGIDMGDGVHIDALQRQLLDERGTLSVTDFEFLGNVVVEISRSAGIDVEDFEARMRETSRTPLPFPPAIGGPSLAIDGKWYLQPLSDGQVVGVAIELLPLIEVVRDDMRGRGLLGEDDGIRVASEPGAFLPVEDLELAVWSPRWEETTDAIVGRYRIKSALAVLVALLVVAIGALSVVAQQRKYRFVEMKSDFVATVSHELRTPLASIRLLAETLERRMGDDPRARDYPSRIIRDIDGLAFLVENILSFNRLEKGRLVPRLHRGVSLEELVHSLDADHDLWARRAARVTVEGLEGFEVEADPDLLRLLLLNLLRNAAQYNERDPIEIHVRADRHGGSRLYVSDNGIGIPDEDRATVFAEFHRGSRLGPAHSRGTGLGLAICRRIMQLHGGSIAIHSSSDAGTTFELRFRR